MPLQRSVCRVEIVRWDSTEDIRYELFNRLNTGASPLSEQEIRNCIFRSYAVDFNKTLREIAKSEAFIELISPSDSKREQMFLEELALRYFAFKHLNNEIKTTVPQYLTEFMKLVSEGKITFNLDSEGSDFLSLVVFLNEKEGKKIFRPKGNFALHLFDSVAYAAPKTFKKIKGNEAEIYDLIRKLKNDKKYNSIGTSTFSNSRIKLRMERALEIFSRA